MAKRPKFSRWRRLPGVYRFGELKPADPNQELQRLSVYVPWSAIDLADHQASRLGFENAQAYCTGLLLKALEEERVREQVAEVEARRGPLEGLNAIASDPEYLAELRVAGVPHVVGGSPPPAPGDAGPPADDVRFLPEVSAEALTIPVPRTAAGPLGPSAWVVLRHAGQSGDDPYAFLPCLRRGEAVPQSELADLAQALRQLEEEYRGAGSLDRGLVFALHRLAFESQILHTDAWPGVFDAWTVDTLRAVQEAVERILSGQDIRYYADPTGPPDNALPDPGTGPGRVSGGAPLP